MPNNIETEDLEIITKHTHDSTQGGVVVEVKIRGRWQKDGYFHGKLDESVIGSDLYHKGRVVIHKPSRTDPNFGSLTCP